MRMESPQMLTVLHYYYDVWGNLTSTVNIWGDSIRMEYDYLGRKTALHDPNIGTVHYRYDALDRVVEENNNGSRIVQQYDALGRLVEKQRPEGTAPWEFDTGKPGMLHRTSFGSENRTGTDRPSSPPVDRPDQ